MQSPKRGIIQTPSFNFRRFAVPMISLASFILLSLGCHSYAAEVSGLPEDYVIVRASGVEVFCRKGEEQLAKSVAESLAEYRGQVAPILEEMCGQWRRVGTSWKKVTSDSKKLDAARAELLALIRPLAADPQKFQKQWEGMMGLWRQWSSEAFLSAWRKSMGGERAKLVSVEDIKAGRVAFLSWDGGKDNPYGWSLGFELDLDTGKEELTSKGRSIAPTAWDYALPIVREDLAVATPKAYLAKRLGSLKGTVADMKKEWFDNKGAMEPEAIVSMILHEHAEAFLVYNLALKDPMARWFHDGFATAVAHEALVRAYGKGALEKALYSPQDCEKNYKDQRALVNLLAWPMNSVQEMYPLPNESSSNAYYAWSASEMRGLIERHGWGKMTKFLEILRDEKDVTTEVICEKIKSVTGEDMMTRLESYCPQDKLSQEELHRSIMDSAAHQKAEEVLALGERLAAAHPRDPLGHAAIAVSNAYIWGEEKFGRSQRAWVVLLNLPGGRKVQLPGMMNAKVITTWGRFYEMQNPMDKDEAKRNYLAALQYDPSYQPAIEHLKALGLSPEDIKKLTTPSKRGLFDE